MPADLYVTPQSLIDEFGEELLIQLTDRADPPAEAVDTAVAQRACDRAIAEIDGYLRARYRLPLSSMPKLLPFLAHDLARYYLYEVEPPTQVQSRYDEAKKTLRAIQDGKQPLGVDDAGADVTDSPQDLAVMDPGSKVFGRGRW